MLLKDGPTREALLREEPDLRLIEHGLFDAESTTPYLADWRQTPPEVFNFRSIHVTDGAELWYRFQSFADRADALLMQALDLIQDGTIQLRQEVTWLHAQSLGCKIASQRWFWFVLDWIWNPPEGSPASLRADRVTVERDEQQGGRLVQVPADPEYWRRLLDDENEGYVRLSPHNREVALQRIAEESTEWCCELNDVIAASGSLLRELAFLVERSTSSTEDSPDDGGKPHQTTSTAPANQTADDESEVKQSILFHRDKCYSVGNGDPFTVTENEDSVLQAFLDTPAMDTSELVRKSGVDRAAATLRSLKNKYDKRFSPFINLPGGKGKGGYSVRIRRAE